MSKKQDLLESFLVFTWRTWRARQTQWSSSCCQRSWGSGSLWNSLYLDRATTCCSTPCNPQRRAKTSQPEWKAKVLNCHTPPPSSCTVKSQSYPGCDLAVPERIGEDCGREWLDPAMLEEEEDEEEEASNPGFLLDERENGPGKLSSMDAKRTKHKLKLYWQGQNQGNDLRKAWSAEKCHLDLPGRCCQTLVRFDTVPPYSSVFSWKPSRRPWHPRCLPVQKCYVKNKLHLFESVGVTRSISKLSCEAPEACHMCSVLTFITAASLEKTAENRVLWALNMSNQWCNGGNPAYCLATMWKIKSIPAGKYLLTHFWQESRLNWLQKAQWQMWKQVFFNVLTLTRTFFFFLVLSLMLRGLFFWPAGFSTPPVPMFHLRPPNSSMAWASVGPSYLPSS